MTVLLVSEPSLGEDEKAALVDVIASNWITMGSRVQRFERAFAEAHQVDDAVAVSSCTAGLHLALQALGIGPGDEVLIPSLTFVATANSVLYNGADPVFVDIESLAVPHMSCAEAMAKCTARTKAVIVMHYAGYLVERLAWREFAQSRGLFLIEDSAHAVGAAWTGGPYGDAAIFSFYGNKNMTTGEGGMVVASDAAILDRVRRARGHGMTSSTVERLEGRAATYDVEMLGYNYRMSELNAALGLVQLKKLGRWNQTRKTLADAYRHVLQRHCPQVFVPFAESWRSSHHIMPVILPEHVRRQPVINALRNYGIQTSLHYPPVHWLSLYRKREPFLCLPHTEQFALRELTLPLHPRLEESHVELVARALGTAMVQACGEAA